MLAIFLYKIILQPSTDTRMPIQHFWVRLRRERMSGNLFGQDIPIGIDNIPQSDCILKVLRVLIRVHQQLYSLPSHEPIWKQRGN